MAALRKVCGLVLIVVGLVAMPVPIIPGIPLVLAGMALLGSDHPLVRRFTQWLRARGVRMGTNGN